MWQQMIDELQSWFVYPGLEGYLMLVGIGLAFVFAAVWLLAHWPPLFREHWLWAVLASSAFITLLAYVFIQIPLQQWTNDAILHFIDEADFLEWVWLARIPLILISGLVQEGAKMLPMVFFWWRRGCSITPAMGLALGAAAGAGYGIFEAVAAHGHIFALGWTPDFIQTMGFDGIAGFWERFFVVGFHAGASAIAGYGLARGKGWQFFLIAAGLHAVLNYSIILLQQGLLTTVVQVETYVAVVSVLVTAVALQLRWRYHQGADGAGVGPVDIDS